MLMIQWRYYNDFSKRHFWVLGYNELEERQKTGLEQGLVVCVKSGDKLPAFDGNQEI